MIAAASHCGITLRTNGSTRTTLRIACGSRAAAITATPDVIELPITCAGPVPSDLIKSRTSPAIAPTE